MFLIMDSIKLSFTENIQRHWNIYEPQPSQLQIGEGSPLD